ncbi:MAG: anaerobic ribonucleoside-triphosphate reductase activating protein [Endomicrobium sp.]|jgi:pyruvate formate lyase activating enzyme|nr:anaerobic ribonucleoside-triphosphate reductase activating protein [Endomicrobium sp.]
MNIGGLQKLSLIEYPEKTAAIIFTQGCNMFCPYCHNPQLVYKDMFEQVLNVAEIFSFLEKRQRLLQAVVITGGEPTVQKDLKDFIRKIKSYRYAVKLDTNGTNPQILEELIKENLINFIAMDIKSPLEKYNLFYKGDIKKIENSIFIIKNSKVPHLFRTTFDEELLCKLDLQIIEELVFPSRHIVQPHIKRDKKTLSSFNV